MKVKLIFIIGLVVSAIVVLFATRILRIGFTYVDIFRIMIIFAPFVVYLITKKVPLFIILLILAVVISMFSISNFDKRREQERITLLENGIITQGTVTERYYQIGAPKGWRINYEFNVDGEKFNGFAQGPKKYYIHLNKGDSVNIIYDPLDPAYIPDIQQNNYEVCEFLNSLDIVGTFKKAGKLHLLEKFKDQYKIEEYSFEDWYQQQWAK